jgi:hypothetical protein
MEFVSRLIGQLVLVTDKNLAKAMPDMLCLAIPKQMTSQDLLLTIAQAWDLARVRGEHFNKGAPFKLSSVANKSAALVISAYRLSLLQAAVDHAVRGDEVAVLPAQPRSAPALQRQRRCRPGFRRYTAA